MLEHTSGLNDVKTVRLRELADPAKTVCNVRSTKVFRSEVRPLERVSSASSRLSPNCMGKVCREGINEVHRTAAWDTHLEEVSQRDHT